MTAPLFAITSPVAGQGAYSTGSTPVAVSGTVQAIDYPVLSVQWYNDANLQSGYASLGGGTWYASVPLSPGLNHISVWATVDDPTPGADKSSGSFIDVTYSVATLPKVLYNSQSYAWSFTQQGNVTPTQWHLKWGTSTGNYTTTRSFAANVFSAPLNTVLPGIGIYYAVICAYDGSVEWAQSPEFACEVVLSLYNPPTGVLTLSAA